MRTNLTGVKADHAWRAIFLENEYLKCTVLPDFGGRLYTCIDKISGQPMFYANPSIKLAQVGYRGSWAELGVEFNFPISHNWASVSPVDFAYAAHEDGSASVWVSNIDRVYGMQWTVELILKLGSSLLEQRVTLYNRSDLRLCRCGMIPALNTRCALSLRMDSLTSIIGQSTRKAAT
jgi:hypothetical protein